MKRCYCWLWFVLLCWGTAWGEVPESLKRDVQSLTAGLKRPVTFRQLKPFLDGSTVQLLSSWEPEAREVTAALLGRGFSHSDLQIVKAGVLDDSQIEVSLGTNLMFREYIFRRDQGRWKLDLTRELALMHPHYRLLGLVVRFDQTVCDEGFQPDKTRS